MRNLFPGLIAGIVFGAGLALSDMVNPARVQAFLDVAGAWDPTLMFVMAAALVPSSIAYLVRRRMTRPLDRRLLIGAGMFGIGWGLAGLCPGPAVAGLVLGAWQPWLFVGAMLAGMMLHHVVTATRAPLPAYEG
jgi:uncharacterized protein